MTTLGCTNDMVGPSLFEARLTKIKHALSLRIDLVASVCIKNSLP